MINLNLKEIFPVDNQSDLSNKLNFNFNQLVALGVGQPGPAGETGMTGVAGPIGPIGLTGTAGSQIYSSAGTSGTSLPVTEPGAAVVGDYYVSPDAIYTKIDAVAPNNWNEVINFTDLISDIVTSGASAWQLGLVLGTGAAGSRLLVPVKSSGYLDRISVAGTVDGTSAVYTEDPPNWYNTSGISSHSQVTVFNFDPNMTRIIVNGSGELNSYAVKPSGLLGESELNDSTFPYTSLLSLYSFYTNDYAAVTADQFAGESGHRHQIELGSVDDLDEYLLSSARSPYTISPTWQNLRIRKYRTQNTTLVGGALIHSDFLLSSADTIESPTLNSRFTWSINKKTAAAAEDASSRQISLGLSNSAIELGADLGNQMTGIDVDGLHIISAHSGSATAPDYKLAIGIDPTNNGSTIKNAIIKSDPAATVDTVLYDNLRIQIGGGSTTLTASTSGLTSNSQITISSTGSGPNGNITIKSPGASGTSGGNINILAPNTAKEIILGGSTSASAIRIKGARLSSAIPFGVSTTRVPAHFSNDTNTLDEYQEGLFTPYPGCQYDLNLPVAAEGVLDATFGVPEFDDTMGKYTKIGNMVTFSLRFSISQWQALVPGSSGFSAYPYPTALENNLLPLDYGNISTSGTAPSRPIIGKEPWQIRIEIPDYWPDQDMGADSIKLNVALSTDLAGTPPLRTNPFTYSYGGSGTAGSGTSSAAYVQPWLALDPSSIHGRFGILNVAGDALPTIDLFGYRRYWNADILAGDTVPALDTVVAAPRDGQTTSILSRVSIYDFLTPYPASRKVYVTVSGSYLTEHRSTESYNLPPGPVPVDPPGGDSGE